MRRSSLKHPPLPIVFLGPSIPDTSDARAVLDADYRPPVKRGDLDGIEAGAIVGIVDGVFHQELAISPQEVHLATRRGVTVFGSSSMGALRAAEVRTVVPVGLIARWYCDGTITRDDEVALVFDPDSRRALSVPMVNVRFAVERLVSSASLSPSAGKRILEAALALPYQERSYPAILRRAGVEDDDRLRDLVGALQGFDLKREDAFALLEELGRADLHELSQRARAEAAKDPTPSVRHPTDDLDRVQVADSYADSNPITIWETGARVEFHDLLRFLKMTGRYEQIARGALARAAIAGRRLERPASSPDDAVQAFFERGSVAWGWRTTAEQHVNLDGMGLGLDVLDEHITHEVRARAVVSRGARAGRRALAQAIRTGMWIEPLQLKREATRLHAFACLSKAGAHHLPSASDLNEARSKVMRSLGVWTWQEVVERCSALGLTSDDVEAFCADLARARHAARAERQSPTPSPELAKRLVVGGLELKASPKVGRRFTTTPQEVMPVVERLRALAGITRVGFVGELAQIGGIHISQASRPDGIWSSTYGSGKGLTPEAALIGGVMEETEKWAQEQADSSAKTFTASYLELTENGGSVVDPARLPIPYDSCYTRELSIAWTWATNLLTGAAIAVPADFVYSVRRRNRITYSKRLGSQIFGTNGLASGFSLEEALLHAICEYVERHAEHADELRSYVAAEHHAPASRFVDPNSLEGHAGAVARQLASSGEIRLREITSEIRIPTIHGWYLAHGDRLSYSGYATHPDPEVACEMAMMEAAQSAAVSSAGGREDLSLHARSLGRHERTRPRLPEMSLHRWLDPDRVQVPASALGGTRLTDVFDEVRWCLARLCEVGVDTVAAVDLTQPGMAPARAVRVIIPRLLSNSPSAFDRRGHIRVLGDLVPQL